MNFSMGNLLCFLRASSSILSRHTWSCLQRQETLQVRRGEVGADIVTLPEALQTKDLWDWCAKKCVLCVPSVVICCLFPLSLHVPAGPGVVAALWSLRGVQIMVSTPGSGQESLVGKRSENQVGWLSRFELYPCRDSSRALTGDRRFPVGRFCREQYNCRTSPTASDFSAAELALFLFIYNFIFSCTSFFISLQLEKGCRGLTFGGAKTVAAFKIVSILCQTFSLA